MRQFGLIGYPLTHSFSQKYFSQKFLQENIPDAEFLNFSISQIEDVENVFKTHPQLKGLSVTIPHKKSIIKYIDDVDEAVQQIGACNCIKINQNKKTGFNTDIVGFENSFKKQLRPYHQKALVLGTGGASAAVQYVLKKMDIKFLIVSRKNTSSTITYEEITPVVFKEFTVIINCTPLGTFPKIYNAPALPYSLLTSNHYLFDLVYNPALTKFLEYGKGAGSIVQNGYEMLVLQAEENWKIWNAG